MKDQWWTAKAEQLQGLADKRDTRGFLSVMRTTFGPSTRGETPIKDKDGTLLKDTVSINQLCFRSSFMARRVGRPTGDTLTSWKSTISAA